MTGTELTHIKISPAERIELTISYMLKVVVVGTIVMSIWNLSFFLMASAVVILLFSALPAIIERRFRITLPIEVDFAVTLLIFLHFIMGEAGDYYNRFWWFDLVLHWSSGIVIGLVGFMIIYFFLYTNRMNANPLLVAVFSVSFSLAAGALWEMFEFSMDVIFRFNMQKTGIVDTMSDLIVDFFGACIVGVGAYRYLKKDEDGVIKTFVNRIIQYNVRLQRRRRGREFR